MELSPFKLLWITINLTTLLICIRIVWTKIGTLMKMSNISMCRANQSMCVYLYPIEDNTPWWRTIWWSQYNIPPHTMNVATHSNSKPIQLGRKYSTKYFFAIFRIVLFPHFFRALFTSEQLSELENSFGECQYLTRPNLIQMPKRSWKTFSM